MQDKEFKAFMVAVHGKKEPDWEERLEECKAIIQELWTGEFKDLIDKDKRIFIRIVSNEEIDALALVQEKEQGTMIFISRRIWASPNLKGRLRSILRHEMLHVTGLKHSDPQFDIEAEKRKVFPWDNIWGYWGQ